MFISGKTEKCFREKLINVGKDLTLQQAIQISQSYEYAQTQMKQMAANQNGDVHMVRQANGRSRRTGRKTGNKLTGATGYTPPAGTQQRQQSGTKPKLEEKCRNCGYNAHKGNDRCSNNVQQRDKHAEIARR